MNNMPPDIKPSCSDSNVPRGVSIVLVSAGKVLVSMRKKTAIWQMPGGHVEPGESCVEGAVRELREETGLRFRADQLVPLLHAVPAISYLDTLYHACSFLIRLPPQVSLPANPEPDKHTDWMWMAPTEFVRMDRLLRIVPIALHAALKDHTELFIPQPLIQDVPNPWKTPTT